MLDTVKIALQQGRIAYRRGDMRAFADAIDALKAAASPAAEHALTTLQREAGDVLAPCLYAVTLRAAPNGCALYVGESGEHSARCKVHIHTHGRCVCGSRSQHPRAFLRNGLARLHGTGMAYAKALPEGMSHAARVQAEEAWAQELAAKHDCGVWCNGARFTP